MYRRHPIRLVSVALLLPVALGAQTPARQHVDVPAVAPRAADVATVDGVVKTYYDVITGPAGQPRQWSRDRSLYIPDLRFVATGVGNQGPYGFFEREVHRVTRSYGNIVQLFSTYEERRTADGPVEGRGINALQLCSDGKRWWVASAIWFDEDPAHPIPAEFLP
ncbi:MAG TPA: hypothetical protein VF976_11695 [Gemmatimonadales bacterium]